jgi:hypothetical protein
VGYITFHHKEGTRSNPFVYSSIEKSVPVNGEKVELDTLYLILLFKIFLKVFSNVFLLNL